MKNRILLSGALVFSAFVIGLSSHVQKAESRGSGARCAVLTAKGALQHSTAVFVGEVTGEEKIGDIKKSKFKVEKYWKGANRKEVEIFVYETARFQSPFKEGEKFLVYAMADDDGKLTVSRCSRSRALEQAEDDIKQLGEGKTPK
jgi:Icc-related predicted phosphoesterase